MIFILVAAFFFLLISHLSLIKRVELLESDQQSKQTLSTRPIGHTVSTPPAIQTSPLHVPVTTGELAATSEQTAVPNQAAVPSPVIRQTTPAYPPTPSPEPAEFFLYRWFKEQALIKVGAIIFFLGAAWFVSYAIEQNWIAPLARILLGILGAVALGAIGYWRAKIDLVQYQVLTVLSTGVLLGTVAASQFSFANPILPAGLALALMTIGVAYAALVALITKTEWLAVTAAAAGLLAPLLIETEAPSSLLLLGYLLCMSTGFILAALTTLWRSVTLTLVLGVSFYISALYADTSELLLWVFVCLFTALFTASITASVARATRPAAIDVTTLATTLLLFLLSAEAMAFSTTIAQFVAAGVAAGIAAWFQKRGASADTVSLYALVSVVLMFMGTSNLFSGVTLTIIFSVQALLLLIGTTMVATVKRSVYVAAATFALPFVTGISDLFIPLWNDGVWHIGLFGVIVLSLAFMTAIVWLIEQPVLRTIPWLRRVAATLFIGWLLYTWMAAGTLSSALGFASVASGFVLITCCITLLATVYVGLRIPEPNWRTGILFAWLPVVITAIGIFSEPAWAQGIQHAGFAATTAVFVAFAALTLLYAFLARQLRLSPFDAQNAFVTLCITIIYSFFWLYAIWHAVYSGTSATVAQYVSYFMLLGFVAHTMLVLRARFVWTTIIIGFGIVPLLISLTSYELSGWSDGWLALNALGLYAATTIILMTATSLTAYVGRVGEAPLIKKTQQVLFSLGGFQVFIIVWMVTHAVAASSASAVAIALFIYTVVGLAAYSYGRTQDHDAAKRIGVLLLGAVVLRLGVIDVWSMEVLWRIVTFLGIGSLFIMTALLERPRSTPLMMSQTHRDTD